MRRLAALSDIHANLPALEAVLAEVEREASEAIVVCGDVIAGPQPVETLERLSALEGVRFVRGNADREAVAAWDEGRRLDPDLEEHPARKYGAWTAERISEEHRDFLAAFEDNVVLEVEGLGEVVFCHAVPWDDNMPILTMLTPEERLRELSGRIDQDVMVCGHTHKQYDRVVGGTRFVNAGSVGSPYEGRRGAYWTMLGPDVDSRCTPYDVEGAVETFRAIGTWGFDDLKQELLSPKDPNEIAQYFEDYMAGRPGG